MRTTLRRAFGLALLSYASFVSAQPHFADCTEPTPTAVNASIVIPGEARVLTLPPNRFPTAIEPGDEIAVHDPRGRCVATATWQTGGVALSIWGDDPRTDLQDGVLPGDTLTFRAWDASARKELTATSISYENRYDASGLFSDDAVLLADVLVFGKRPCIGRRRCRDAEGARPAGDEAKRQEVLAFSLSQNYPNPFAARTTLAFALDAPGPARLDVYDLLGRRVATLVDGERAAGRHEVGFDARGLASGAYVVRLVAGARSATRRLLVMR